MAASESERRVAEEEEADTGTVGKESDEIVSVCLRKNSRGGGFGFNIHGGTDHPHIVNDPGIFITVVHIQGPAAEEGSLQVGDKILEINGTCVRNRKHREVVDIFIAKDEVDLLVEKNAEARAQTEHVFSQNGTIDQVDSASPSEKGILSQVLESWIFAGGVGVVTGYLLIYLLMKLRNK